MGEPWTRIAFNQIYLFAYFLLAVKPYLWLEHLLKKELSFLPRVGYSTIKRPSRGSELGRITKAPSPPTGSQKISQKTNHRGTPLAYSLSYQLEDILWSLKLDTQMSHSIDIEKLFILYSLTLGSMELPEKRCLKDRDRPGMTCIGRNESPSNR